MGVRWGPKVGLGRERPVVTEELKVVLCGRTECTRGWSTVGDPQDLASTPVLLLITVLTLTLLRIFHCSFVP